MSSIAVALFTRAWIEIFLLVFLTLLQAQVALFTRAWIEIHWYFII